jgi:hypothetical protein
VSTRKRPPREANRSHAPPPADGIEADTTPPPDPDAERPVSGAPEGRPDPGTGSERASREPIQLEVTRPTNERLDSYVADRLQLSRTRIASLIRQGRVRVNGQTGPGRSR